MTEVFTGLLRLYVAAFLLSSRGLHSMVAYPCWLGYRRKNVAAAAV